MFTLGTRLLCTLSSANGTRIALKPLCLMKSKYQAIEWAQSPFGTISGSSAPNQLTPLSTTGCPAIRRVPPEAVKSGSALQSTDMRSKAAVPVLTALCSGARGPASTATQALAWRRAAARVRAETLPTTRITQQRTLR